MTHIDQTRRTLKNQKHESRILSAGTLSLSKEEAQRKSEGFEFKELTGIVTQLRPNRLQVFVTETYEGDVRVGSSQLLTFNDRTQFSHDYVCQEGKKGSLEVGQALRLRAHGWHALEISMQSSAIRGLLVHKRAYKDQFTLELTHVGGLNVDALPGFQKIIEIQSREPLPASLRVGQTIESRGHFRTGDGPAFVLDAELEIKPLDEFEAESILLVSTEPLQLMAQGQLTGSAGTQRMNVAISLAPDVSIIVKRGEILLQLSEQAFCENFEAHQLNSLDIDGEYDVESRTFVASLIIVNS